MAHLVDTSILGRLANTTDAQYATALQAVTRLHSAGETLYTAPQNLIEFRNFATRPLIVNGLGLSAAVVDGLTARFEAAFPLLPETPDVYPAWKALVHAAGTTGKQVHDARLAAICQVYGVTHILTFNVQHFQALAAIPPVITVVDPATV
jgi:predicted nucleic acid-binding protein